MGALTENLSPLKSRPWQVKRHATTCPHCGFGCAFQVDVYARQVVTDVIQNTENSPNRGSLCVMGRFGYDFANHEARIRQATTKNMEHSLDIEEAAAAALERLVKLDAEGKAIGFIVSPRATNEEIYLVKEIAGRFKKSSVATSGYYHTGRVQEAYGRSGFSYPYEYDRLLDADLIIVAGANLLTNNHVLGDRVREAYKLKGTRIMVIDPAPTALSAIADAHLKVLPGTDGVLFHALSARLAAGTGGAAEDVYKECGVSTADFERAFRLISRSSTVAVIFGSGVSASEESLDGLLAFSAGLGLDKKGLVMPIARAANAVGACSLIGCGRAPHEVIADSEVKGLFFYEEDPFHYMAAGKLTAGLQEKEFVFVADALPTAIMDHANLVAPTGVFVEKEGTFFAGDGRIRRLAKAMGCATGVSYAGFVFLSELLRKLKGPVFQAPHEVTAVMREKGMIRAAEGKEEVPAGTAATGRTASPSSKGKTEGSYTLVIRDLFSNHLLAHKDAYSRGVSSVYPAPRLPRVRRQALHVARRRDCCGPRGGRDRARAVGGRIGQEAALGEGGSPAGRARICRLQGSRGGDGPHGDAFAKMDRGKGGQGVI